MQDRNRTKLILDIVLTIMFIILMYAKNTGYTFHEIAGLAMGGLFLYHIILNWQWVKSVTKNLFNPKLKPKPKLFYLLNIVSFIAVAVIIFTGIQISMVLFPSEGMISHSLVVVHKWVAYSCLGLFGLHIALHWQFIVKTIPKLFRTPARPAWGKAGLSMAAVILMLLLLYAQSGAGTTNESSNKNEKAYVDRPKYDYESTVPESSAYINQTGQDSAPSTTDSTNEIGSNQTGQGSSAPITDSADEISSSQSNQDSGISSDNGSIGSDNNDDQLSLTSYLSNMFCDGCEKHCSLLSLRCDRGTQYLQAAQEQYQAIYGSASL